MRRRALFEGESADDLLPIGTFARRCRLSVKALRHYDELDLLRPQHVDVATGYRYYSRRQAPVAIAIALLRSLDVPLAVICELLASDDDAAIAAALEGERRRRLRDIAAAESALRSIDRLLRARSLFPYEVEVRDEPSQTVLVVEGTTSAELHVSFGKSLVRDLLGRLEQLGRRQLGPIVCVMPPAPQDTVVLRMCTAVADPPAAPPERIETLPATRVAATRHVGPYEEIGLAEHTLRAFAEHRGLASDGWIREVYRNDPDEVAADALETDVLLPITPASGRTRDTAAGRR